MVKICQELFSWHDVTIESQVRGRHRSSTLSLMIAYLLRAERCWVWLRSFRVQGAALFHFAMFRVNTRPFLIDAVLTHVAVPEHSDHSVHTLQFLTR
jgi:hypothetical protein